MNRTHARRLTALAALTASAICRFEHRSRRWHRRRVRRLRRWRDDHLRDHRRRDCRHLRAVDVRRRTRPRRAHRRPGQRRLAHGVRPHGRSVRGNSTERVDVGAGRPRPRRHDRWISRWSPADAEPDGREEAAGVCAEITVDNGTIIVVDAVLMPPAGEATGASSSIAQQFGSGIRTGRTGSCRCLRDRCRLVARLRRAGTVHRGR